jgi:hypothetical protein
MTTTSPAPARDRRPGGPRSLFWQPRIETALYRRIAAWAARHLGGLDLVRAVYARRSVASGEVVLGSSDVDLHVIIRPFRDPLEEGRALAALAERLRRLRRLLPILGDFDASTASDLDRWYRARPANWHRDRGWLLLWGEPHPRPAPAEDTGSTRPSAVRWFLFTAQRLPDLVRLGSAHHCANVAADLLHAYHLARGDLGSCRLRSEVLERWRRDDGSDPRRGQLAAAYATAFRRGGRGAVEIAHSLALELGDALATELGLGHAGEPPLREVVSRPPFGFEERRYLLVEPRSTEQTTWARRELARDPRSVPTTLATLDLQLRFLLPWEWEGMARANPSLPLRRPGEADYLAAVRDSLHGEFARRAGFFPGGALSAELRLAQCKLFLDEGRVAVSRADLDGVYESIYGRPPGPPPASAGEYFATRFPASMHLIDELLAHPRLG